ncbi:MAG: ASPIC/UnbV domain-containing protein, partial [Planctomycetaceae bacterium]|nr:ASPIC/UnbV domain-containing protein [Planctomycetaceae bacterium]
YRQQTAGDGYMASNQRQLIFGTGSAKTVGPLEIHWPSGRRDRFDTVPIDCELILVEGRQPARVPR